MGIVTMLGKAQPGGGLSVLLEVWPGSCAEGRDYICSQGQASIPVTLPPCAPQPNLW